MKMLFVSTIAALLATGSSIQCYRCEVCKEPFDPITAGVITCPTSIPCMKAIVEFNSGMKLTTRSCGSLPSLNSSKSILGSRIDSSGDLAAVHAYLCSKSLCNNAESIYSTIPLVVIGTGFLLFHSVIDANWRN